MTGVGSMDLGKRHNRHNDKRVNLGLKLLRIEIRDNTSAIYRASFSKISHMVGTLSPSWILFKIASIPSDFIGEKIFFGFASFLTPGRRRYRFSCLGHRATLSRPSGVRWGGCLGRDLAQGQEGMENLFPIFKHFIKSNPN
jgi:hypothetical protein